MEVCSNTCQEGLLKRVPYLSRSDVKLLIVVATLWHLHPRGVASGSTISSSFFFSLDCCSFCRPRKLLSLLTTSNELTCLGSSPVAFYPLRILWQVNVSEWNL